MFRLLLGGTRLPVSVSGTCIPAFTVLAPFLNTAIGPDEPDTVMVAVALATFGMGAITLLAGCVGVKGLVRACPYLVYVAFLTYTGVALLGYALNIVVPDFNLIKFDTYTYLADWTQIEKYAAPVVVAIFSFLVRKDWGSKPGPLLNSLIRYVVPLCTLLLSIGFYLLILITGSDAKTAREDGWLFETASAPSLSGFADLWTKRDFGKVKCGLLLDLNFFTTILKMSAIGLLTLIEETNSMRGT